MCGRFLLTTFATQTILCVAKEPKVHFKRHSHTAAAAYHDLVSLLLDDTVSDIRGTPTRRTRGSRGYWYDRYRVGKDTKEQYLGEDTGELRARIENHQMLKERRVERARARARLVRLLRSERFLGLDATSGSLVANLAKSGAFRVGGVLVGTIAFLLYEGELGLRLAADETARTSDIDLASFERHSDSDELPKLEIPELLESCRFDPLPSLENDKTWRWRQEDGTTLVEFLTPSFRDDEGLRELPQFGVSARALHHLDYVISHPLDVAAVYRDGILVKAPRPEKFAIHKLIVADRRRDGLDSLKAHKDLMQAEILMSILAEDRPSDLIDAYEEAMSRGPHWRERLDATLTRAPQVAALLEKSKESS